MTKLVVGSATDVGLVRANNQDQMLVAPGLYAVADGMGGHAAGEVASATAVRALQAAFEASGERSSQALGTAARAANRAVWEQARANRGMFGMGTTLVALAVVEHEDGTSGLAVAHIGDSRLYLWKQGGLDQLTVDHTLVQELIDDGQLSPAQASIHPQRHVLTRALGVEPSADIDVFEVKPQHGDRYLLCSDGLPREASDKEIGAVLGRYPDPTAAARELINLAKSRGGNDNITVVVVDVLANDSSPDTLIVVPGPDAFGGPPTESSAGAGGGQGGTAAPALRAQPGRRGAATAESDEPGTSTSEGDVAPAKDSAVPPPDIAPVHLAASPKRFTWRVLAFVAAAGAVIGGAIGAIAWYARSAYFVTVSHGNIDVYQGRPGGVLWFGPTLAERTRYTAQSVPQYELATLEQGELVPSLSQANLYIRRLVSQKIEAQVPLPGGARGAPHGKQLPSPSKTGTAKLP